MPAAIRTTYEVNGETVVEKVPKLAPILLTSICWRWREVAVTAPRVCGASCVPNSSQTAKTGARQRFVNDGSLAYDSLEPLQQFVKLMAYNNCEKVRVRDLENHIGCF